MDNFQLQPDEDSMGGLTATLLRGTVHHVVYQNQDTGYTVLRMTVGNREESVVGSLSGIHAGEELELKGKWEQHKTHGKQFKVDSFRITLPSSEKGIIRYLSSGFLKGIGPKIAEQIVAHFGADTLNIISHHSKRLQEVPGFGKKRLEQFQQAWNKEGERRDLFIFLHALGITTTMGQKLYKIYGSQTGHLIRENPYRLADDVHGIGFLSADRIAGELGVEKESPKRICAGVLFALKQLIQSGHTCYPIESFYDYCASLIALDVEFIKPQIQWLADQNKVVIERLKQFSEMMIYDASMYKLECELVHYLHQCLNSSKFATEKIVNVKPISKVAFSVEQLQAVDAVGHSPMSIITGGPGVGKTTVISELVNRALAKGLRIALAAPTGRAAKRMSESTKQRCSTLHRMLKWLPATGTFEYGINKKLPFDLLVIDEVSMLDLPLATYLFRAVGVGTSVVFVGDADQLPSVGAGKVLHDLIASRQVPTTHLSRIYRQADSSQIITNAHLINEGRMPLKPEFATKSNQDFYWIEQDDATQAVEQILEMVVNRIPKRFGFDPKAQIQVLCPMNRGECGVLNLNRLLQTALNGKERPQIVQGDRILREGDRVMQTSNNYDLNVFNGDLGTIKDIFKNANDSFIIVDFDGREVVYPISDANQLVLSYAITVHKSQGSEFPCVIIPLLSQHYIMLQRNLLYTAITRAKSLLILVGSSKAVSMAVRNTKTEPRFTSLCERLLETFI